MIAACIAPHLKHKQERTDDNNHGPELFNQIVAALYTEVISHLYISDYFRLINSYPKDRNNESSVVT